MKIEQEMYLWTRKLLLKNYYY